MTPLLEPSATFFGTPKTEKRCTCCPTPSATFFGLVGPEKRCTWVVGVVVALACLIIGWPARAEASLQPIGLSVDESEESWHVEPSFALRWINPPEPIAAVHYRLLWPSGEEAVGETRVGWAATSLQYLSVPLFPGAYTAEVWLEDDQGNEGMPVAATLRFDDARPGQVEPLADAGWIGRTAFPYPLRLSRPAAPEPLSGIRGYAVSIDRSTSGMPCDGPYVCSDAETNLRGGVAADTLAIADLPEGTSYVHAVAVSSSGMRSAAAGTAMLKVDKTDPATSLTGVPGGWSNRPLLVQATAHDGASGMEASGAGGPFTAIRIDGGAPIAASGDSVAATVIESGAHTVEYYGRDAAGNVADGGRGNGSPASTVVRIDRDPPSVAFVNALDPRDPERIEARASDSLSGLAPEGGSIAVRRTGSGERFADLPTQLDGGTLRARWDSETGQPGEYEFRAIAYDRAGNTSASMTRGNGTPMKLSAPLKVRTALIADSGRRRLRYGRGTVFHGRLLSGRRAPLPGVAVQVIERFEAGAQPRERTSTVRSSNDGGFALHLAPGPSREVFATVAPSLTRQGASSQPLQLKVRSGVQLKVSAPVAQVGGQPIIFSGKVSAAGTPIPPEGKAVQLQFRLPGLPWSEFRTIHTDRRGNFRYLYRFADDDSRGVQFQFRAFTPPQANWPYQPSTSRPVVVRGA